MLGLGLGLSGLKAGFSPSSIVDSYGDSLLRQHLLTSVSPTLAGVIRDEKPSLGDARDIQPGRAYDFDGVNDYIETGYKHSNGLTEFTIACEIFNDTWTDGSIVLSSQRGLDTITFAQETFGVNRYRLRVFDNANTLFQLTSDTTLSLSTWYKLVVRLRGGVLEIFIDGVSQGTLDFSTGTGVVRNSGGVFDMGGVSTGSNSNCKIHDMRFYERGWTDDEVILHNDNKSVIVTDLKFQYKCEDINPTVAYDSSGNSNHGTKNNITASTFHYEGDDVPHSFQNEVGYREGVNLLSQSNNFTDSDWSGFYVKPTFTGGQADPFGGNDAWTWNTSTTTGNDGTFGGVIQSGTHEDGETYTVSCWLRASSNVNLKFGLTDGRDATIAVTTEWQRFESTSTGDTGLQQRFFQLYDRTNVDVDVYVYGAQTEVGAAATDYENTGDAASAGDLVPRDESDTSKDIFGNTLQYSGKVPMNGQAVNSPCGDFDGVDDYINAPVSGTASFPFELSFSAVSATDRAAMSLCSSSSSSKYFAVQVNETGRIVVQRRNATSQTNTIETSNPDLRNVRVVFHSSTSFSVYADEELITTETGLPSVSLDSGFDTVAIGVLRVVSPTSFFDGIIYNTKYVIGSDTEGYWPISERSGATVHDVSGNGNHGTIMNATTTTDTGFWGQTQDVFHWSLAKGFTANGNVHVPALADGSADADGNTIGSAAGSYHNGCTTQIDFAPVAAPGTSGWENDYSFDDGRTNPLFVRENNALSFNDRFLAYGETLSGDDLTKVNNYVADI